MNKKTRLIYFQELKIQLAFVKFIYEGITDLHEVTKLEQNEKERIRNIVKLCNSMEKQTLQTICRDILKLKVHHRKASITHPGQKNDYYIVPTRYTVEHFREASIGTATISMNNQYSKEPNPFLNNFNSNKKKENLNEKELINPKGIGAEEFAFAKNEIIEFPEIKIPKKTVSENRTNKEEIVRLKGGNQKPVKVSKNVTLTNRDQSIVKSLKQLYNNECQICAGKIEVGKGKFYSEVHHIQPLGTHNGPDISENMIVLCPNHHRMFDMGVIRINIVEKKVHHYNKNNVLNGKVINLKHNINEKYTTYHDSQIFKGSINQKTEKEKRVKEVSYGDTVIFWDGEEENEVLIETYHNRHFMNNMQRMLLFKKEGEKFSFNGFTYCILKVK
ncbi:HNH endonuclease [Priestia megaterium]|uniref:HNH endonuclease n=1 Tax=Priestia megaterium TaxID=1404 RepID=UPI002079FAD6|nr:HNH endonuclease [Priestia megaterium]USL34823.1 HNH endonuclease [Priestia megaterium]